MEQEAANEADAIVHIWKKEALKCQFMRPVFKVVGYQEGRFLVNSPDHGKVILYDEKLTEHALFQFDAKPQSICTASEVPNGAPSHLFVGCNNGSVRKVDVATREEQPFQAQTEHERYVNDLVIVDNCLVNCYNNGTIRVWQRHLMVEKVTMREVHASYIYKLRVKGNRLFSCGHDAKVVLTDLTVCEPIRCFVHPQSVWGIHAISYNEFASVGLFGMGMIWDVRVNRLVQSWLLSANESSFITEMQPNVFVMGDAAAVKTFDRRNGKMELRRKMLVSAEAIYKSSENKLVLAGRGGDIMVCRTDETAAVPMSSLTPTAMLAQEPIYLAGAYMMEDEVDSEEEGQEEEEDQDGDDDQDGEMEDDMEDEVDRSDEGY